jgi:hypothetical protein
VLSTPLGTLLGAPLVQTAGPSATLLLCGLATAAVGAIALLVRLRVRAPVVHLARAGSPGRAG